MNPATATRAEIREYVGLKHKARADAKKAGGNVAHVELDQQDELVELLDGLEMEEKERFLRIHTEESIAIIESGHQDADDIVRKIKKANRQESKAAGVAVFMFVVVLVIIVLAIKK